MIKFAALLQPFYGFWAKLKTPTCTMTNDIICIFNLKSVEQKDSNNTNEFGHIGLYHIGLS